MEKIYAVFTGDLIGSSKALPQKVEATMQNLADTGDRLSRLTGSDTKFTRYRGDGWQLLLADPGNFLLGVLLILARLRAAPDTLRTRIAIGAGAVHSLGTSDLRDAQGFAFTVSGQALDSLKRDRNIVLASAPNDPLGILGGNGDRAAIQGQVDWYGPVILGLVGFIAGHWTRAQAEAVAIALEHGQETQAEIAARLGITRQALNLRLTGAGYGPLRGAVKLTAVFAQPNALCVHAAS